MALLWVSNVMMVIEQMVMVVISTAKMQIVDVNPLDCGMIDPPDVMI
jgi:hypothetical protein